MYTDDQCSRMHDAFQQVIGAQKAEEPTRDKARLDIRPLQRKVFPELTEAQVADLAQQELYANWIPTEPRTVRKLAAALDVEVKALLKEE